MLNKKAIGGYFELELPRNFSEKYPNALKFQSARAAFLALLQQMPHIKRVWMPYYICDSMMMPVYAAGKELSFYTINQQFKIEHPPELSANDLLLYVNYFGICDSNVFEVIAQFNPEQIIIDCSQAFYSGPFQCLATIYSLRKFFGVPDGGLLVTSKDVVLPACQDVESIKRCTHLLERLAFSAETGYESYKMAEASLDDPTPKRMSQLTQIIMATIDYSLIENKRSENFAFLQKELGSTNKIKIKDTSTVAPLCYPYLQEKEQLKELLINEKIFIPTYWPDVTSRINEISFEKQLIKNMLAIPCDQRYKKSDLTLVVDLIKQGEML
ncbi:MAG: hypothetical protein PHX60_04220 [Giesbergeria sp.]|uniref:hypothetical protein n=1 Tax=Giesbergeria sp. TaxID=2818473 RepID=UPI002623F53C|nr:hypothetical protein [Giesbergeria sp.]MDD2608886.1 hypothetical protein [Giesbergeria sp.]